MKIKVKFVKRLPKTWMEIQKWTKNMDQNQLMDHDPELD